MTDREGCVAVNMISGVGYVKYSALCKAFGSPAAIRTATRGELLEVPGIGAQLAERIVAFNWDAELSREFGIADRGGVRILTLCDEAYPDILRQLYDPPLCLYIRGRLPEFPEHAVAIVGSRRCSSYGERMTGTITREAVQCGFSVISGLAMGVDAVAHRVAVESGGITVAVLGAGLMHVHPKENLPLARSIVESGGAVISEFPLGFPVARTNFPRRNRIVAGLCRETIVIEAGLESGALITAHLAMEDGRDVFAVPGHADNPQAAGCHKLIKEGAGLIESFDDVAVALHLGLLPGMAPGEAGTEGAPGYMPDSIGDLDASSAGVFQLLAKGDASLDELREASGMDTGILLAALMKLELKLLVERTPDQIYHLLGRRGTAVEKECE